MISYWFFIDCYLVIVVVLIVMEWIYWLVNWNFMEVWVVKMDELCVGIREKLFL